uniref:Uncharacterized protein n=1 Tax=Arundo donax TaxID=35708 RepID=A0A0A8ZHJ7_ARUDO
MFAYMKGAGSKYNLEPGFLICLGSNGCMGTAHDFSHLGAVAALQRFW